MLFLFFNYIFSQTSVSYSEPFVQYQELGEGIFEDPQIIIDYFINNHKLDESIIKNIISKISYSQNFKTSVKRFDMEVTNKKYERKAIKSNYLIKGYRTNKGLFIKGTLINTSSVITSIGENEKEMNMWYIYCVTSGSPDFYCKQQLDKMRNDPKFSSITGWWKPLSGTELTNLYNKIHIKSVDIENDLIQNL